VAAGRYKLFSCRRSWRFYPAAIDKWEVDQTGGVSAQPAETGSSPKSPDRLGLTLLDSDRNDGGIFASSAARGPAEIGRGGLVSAETRKISLLDSDHAWPPNHNVPGLQDKPSARGTPTKEDNSDLPT